MLITSGMRLTPARLNAERVVSKTVDEGPLSVAGLQDDDHLFMTVAADTHYRVELDLGYVATTGADFLLGWSTPAGVSGFWTALNPTAGSAINAPYLGARQWDTTVTFDGFAGPVEMYARLRGSLRVGGTAGTLRFRWSPNVSAASATVRANSMLSLKRVG